MQDLEGTNPGRAAKVPRGLCSGNCRQAKPATLQRSRFLGGMWEKPAPASTPQQMLGSATRHGCGNSPRGC